MKKDKSAQRKNLETALKILLQDIDYYERVMNVTREQLEAANKKKRQVEMALARIP